MICISYSAHVLSCHVCSIPFSVVNGPCQSLRQTVGCQYINLSGPGSVEITIPSLNKLLQWVPSSNTSQHAGPPRQNAYNISFTSIDLARLYENHMFSRENYLQNGVLFKSASVCSVYLRSLAGKTKYSKIAIQGGLSVRQPCSMVNLSCSLQSTYPVSLLLGYVM